MGIPGAFEAWRARREKQSTYFSGLRCVRGPSAVRRANNRRCLACLGKAPNDHLPILETWLRPDDGRPMSLQLGTAARRVEERAERWRLMAWSGDKPAKRSALQKRRHGAVTLAPEFLRPDGSAMTRMEYLCGPRLLLPEWLP
jgi:hypothetical protein